MLFLVATPIGNLADMTFRAVSVLKECSYILCEDTRLSQNLLRHYQIETVLKSFHKFSEAKQESAIIRDLKEGKKIALISDAGMPLICDPGARLVEACHKEQISVYIVPGPSAFVSAIALSGWQKSRMQFLGFLPKKEKEICSFLQDILAYQGVSVVYETAKRLVKTLLFIERCDPLRKVAVARELTKKFEEYREGTAAQLLLHYQEHPPKGEIVLLIDEKGPIERVFTDAVIVEMVENLRRQEGLSLSEAIRQAAIRLSFPRKKIYAIMHLALKEGEC